MKLFNDYCVHSLFSCIFFFRVSECRETESGVSIFDLATALIVTFMVENHVDEDTCKNKDAMLWEAEFIKYLSPIKGKT